MHDPYLHRITNALDHQFPHAKEVRYYESEKKYHATQWTDLLNLSEMRCLTIRQKQAKSRPTSMDYYFVMPTLEEVILKVI
jgi:hypothetical protein